MTLDFQSPEAYGSPEQAVMTRLFASLIDDELSELSYDAELAGLRYSVSNSQSGFLVRLPPPSSTHFPIAGISPSSHFHPGE